MSTLLDHCRFAAQKSSNAESLTCHGDIKGNVSDAYDMGRLTGTPADHSKLWGWHSWLAVLIRASVGTALVICNGNTPHFEYVMTSHVGFRSCGNIKEDVDFLYVVKSLVLWVSVVRSNDTIIKFIGMTKKCNLLRSYWSRGPWFISAFRITVPLWGESSNTTANIILNRRSSSSPDTT